MKTEMRFLIIPLKSKLPQTSRSAGTVSKNSGLKDQSLTHKNMENEQIRYEDEKYHYEINKLIDDLLKSIDTLKYWEGVSDHFCECKLPIGSCLKCEMMRTIGTLKDTLKYLKP